MTLTDRQRRLLRISVVFATLIGTGLTYVSARLLPDLGLTTTAQWLWLGLSCVLLLLMALSFLAPYLLVRNGLRSALAWAGMTCIGAMSSVFVLTLLRDVGLAFWLLHPDPVSIWAREASAWAVLLLALLMTLMGFYNARRVHAITQHEVPVPGLASGFDGLKVAQLSDIHIGPTVGPRLLQHMVAQCNAQQPDVVVITGDLVDGSVSELAETARLLQGLQAPHGVFVAMGNHDYYSGALEWQRFWQGLGFHVLINEHRVLVRCGQGLAIAGIADHGAAMFVPQHAPSAEQTFADLPDDVPTLLLAHQPIAVTYATHPQVVLQLSGHTHGGQFFPWRPFVKLQQPIISGWSYDFAHPVYVSRGTGYWGPPKRLFAPSEVAVFTLRALNK